MNKLKAARRKALADQCNVSAIEADLTESLRTITQALDAEEDSPEDHAMAAVMTFCAVALHALKATPPSVIRNAARVIEIRARLDGVPFLTTSENQTGAPQ